MNISYHLLIVTNDFDIVCFCWKRYSFTDLLVLLQPALLDPWSIYFLMSVHLGSACINWPMAITLHANIDTNRSKCRIVRLNRKKETKHSVEIGSLGSLVQSWPADRILSNESLQEVKVVQRLTQDFHWFVHASVAHCFFCHCYPIIDILFHIRPLGLILTYY